jgi:formate dehydrogenase major subunit
VQDGLVVTTSTPEIEAYRRLRLEQLLSDHNADCVAPCVTTCPANIDIQGYLRQAACGNFDAALRIIKERNPLPLSVGRVCPHPCESQCRRNLVDEPVGINFVKRFVADWDISREHPFIPEKKPATGKKLAIIGGGPSGLTAAWYSAINGHDVTIFESHPLAGGMLRYGIPEYRLPKAVLDREIGLVQSLGVKIITGKALGRDLRLEELKRNFDAIYLAVGSWRASTMRIDGEQANNVWLGINYLEQTAKNSSIPLGDKVIVIGGGNTAIDCARVALRHGAHHVTLVYRRSREEMPAETFEIEEALHEGIEMVFLAAPQKIECDPVTRNVTGLRCIRMQLGETDRSGRRRPEPVEGSEFTLAASAVIGAIGQSTDTSYLWDDLPVKLNKWGDVEVNSRTMQTSVDGIFSGGDCVTGPATVVQAVGAGRRAAEAINDYLLLGFARESHEDYTCNRGTLEDLPRFEFEIMPRAARAAMPAIDIAARAHNFAEIETGLCRQQAITEAERCLACGCNERYNCELRCEATAHGLEHRKPIAPLPYRPIVNDHPFIVRDHNKCISCGRCLAACKEIEGPDVLGFYLKDGKQLVGTRSGRPLAETDCISCGQCVTTCPCGALDYRREYDKVFNAIHNSDRIVAGFIAPAVRSAVASFFNIPPAQTAGYMAGMMKALGFDLVFDLSFAADLTILEETTEFITRVQNGGTLPQFTSCCPGWVNLLEKRYPDMIPHISSCKSPQQMMVR